MEKTEKNRLEGCYQDFGVKPVRYPNVLNRQLKEVRIQRIPGLEVCM